MSVYFDDLIREGRDTDAMRVFAKEYYDNGKMGHTRKLLCERMADENDRLKDEVDRLKQMVKSITGGLDEAIETNQYLEKIIDGLKGDLQKVATDESTEGFPCICSICELACKCPDEKRDPYSNEDSLCKFVWKGLNEKSKP